MKKILLVAGISCMLLSACKERDIPLDFGSASLVDSTYVLSSIPAADPHQVLVEEFTGQSCVNCPTAKQNLDTLSSENAGRINVLSMYPLINTPDTDPPPGAQNDLRDAVAADIFGVGVYNSPDGFPALGIDRTVNGGALYQVGRTGWQSIITGQLGVVDSVNLSLSASYNASKNIATIIATATYLQAIDIPQNLSIVLVEDDIYGYQKLLSGKIDSSYLFTDVFRGMVTSAPLGDHLTVPGASPDSKEAGRVFRKTYSYHLPVKTPAIVPANCRLVAFVSNYNGSDKHVLQSVQCKLIQ